MSLAALFAALAAATATSPTPSPEALEMARHVASRGVLASITPLQTQAEVEEMIAEHPELTPEEQTALRRIGGERTDALLQQAIEAEAAAMAEALSLEDLRVLADFADSPAAEHQREALPRIMLGTMQALGDIDFGGSVRQAFCSETGKLCNED